MGDRLRVIRDRMNTGGRIRVEINCTNFFFFVICVYRVRSAEAAPARGGSELGLRTFQSRHVFRRFRRELCAKLRGARRWFIHNNHFCQNYSNVAQILLYGRTRGSCRCTRRASAGSVRSPMRARSSRSRTPREPRSGGWCPCGFGRPVMPRYAVGTACRRLVRGRRTYTGSA